MPPEIIEKITRRLGIPDLWEKLNKQISSTELNSFLLELFSHRTNQISPTELLSAYQSNRFVTPVSYEWIPFIEWELEILRFAQENGFEPLELSPVSPLGACSVVATVHQHKVLSALRGTEVVSDATNVLALESSLHRQAFLKKDTKSAARVRLCTTHRHLRTSFFNFPGFTPHFKIFCLTLAGRDEGSFRFETESIVECLRFYYQLLTEKIGIESSRTRLILKDLRQAATENLLFEALQKNIDQSLPQWTCEMQEIHHENANYYKGLQFKIILDPDGNRYDIGDGGFVNWTQQLLGNRKERFLISGLGTEFLYKLLNRHI
ncbi:MAG: hypothetical protein SFU99_08120 [Saprospiraceae bacterium]|nr:hypothetical protein [Saprospiraceae bacterium]